MKNILVLMLSLLIPFIASAESEQQNRAENAAIKTNLSKEKEELFSLNINTIKNILRVSNFEFFDKYIAITNTDRKLMILEIGKAGFPQSTPIAEAQTKGRAWSVSVEGEYAYVASDDEGAGTGECGLEIFNISDKHNPKYLGFLKLPLLGPYITVKEKVAYIMSQGKLIIINVSDPQNPILLKALETKGADTDKVYIAENKLICSTVNKLSIFRISEPKNPVLLGEYNYGSSDNDPWTHTINDFMVKGNAIYINYRNGLSILDISNPNNIKQISYIGEDSYAGSLTGAIAILDGIGYVTSEYRGIYKLLAVDITNPTVPKITKSFQFYPACSKMTARSPYVYYSDTFSLSYFNPKETEVVSTVDKVLEEKSMFMPTKLNPSEYGMLVYPGSEGNLMIMKHSDNMMGNYETLDSAQKVIDYYKNKLGNKAKIKEENGVGIGSYVEISLTENKWFKQYLISGMDNGSTGIAVMLTPEIKPGEAKEQFK